jgi:DNA-binding NarL/FixJ family response regulator
MNIPADRKITVIHASPWQLYRNGVKLFLEKRENIEFIGEAATGEELLELLAARRPYIIILDICVSGGFEALAKVREQFPAIRVIILTLHNDPSIITKALGLGAYGYLTSDAGSDDIYDAIISCFKNRVYLNVGARASQGRSFEYLGANEIRMIRLLAQNTSIEIIARELDLSLRTVHVIIERLKSLSCTATEEELVALARKKGFIEPEAVHEEGPEKLPFWRRFRFV